MQINRYNNAQQSAVDDGGEKRKPKFITTGRWFIYTIKYNEAIKNSKMYSNVYILKYN